MAKMVLKFKEAVLKEIPLDRDVLTIGRREGNDIPIENPAVSGSHAKIVKTDQGFAVEDLNSLNGTFVNGRKIAKHDLKPGDSVLVGSHVLVFVGDQEEGEPRLQPARSRSMDETMVLSPLEQKKILASAAPAVEKKEPLGGFLVIEGSTEKKDYLLKERITTIGKDDGAAIKLKGFFAPKVAALVNRRKEGYFITPSGGKEIKVNTGKVEQRCDLKDGDMVEVGDLKMQFYIKEE